MRCTANRGVDFQTSDKTLAEVVEIAADIPLIAQPGAEWNYSIATDVLGHLVAVISGKPFDQFLRERVTGPLGMVDTDFHVPADKLSASRRTTPAGGRPADADRRSAEEHLRHAAHRSAPAAAAWCPRRPTICASAR